MSQENTAGRWPPRACEMPNLSSLTLKASPEFVLNRVFAHGGPTNSKSYALVMNFVRIVDKLIIEYEHTRVALSDFVDVRMDEDFLSPLLIATCYCESCISTMVRAINLGRSIRKDPNGPPIARDLIVLTDQVMRRIKNMRNAIEHIDERIIKNTWVPGEPVCLLLKDDRLELSGEEISYKELAEWILELHNLALQVAPYKES